MPSRRSLSLKSANLLMKIAVTEDQMDKYHYRQLIDGYTRIMITHFYWGIGSD